MFEQGDGTKLNDEVIGKLAKKFGIELKTAEAPVEKPVVASASVLEAARVSQGGSDGVLRGFCPNPHCPSNHAYQVEEIRLLKPNRLEADPVGGKYCAICGELLEKKCPNCGAPVHEGAICSICGDPYVAVVS